LLSHSSFSDIGKARSNNEDCYLVSKSAPLFVVADGIGGHNYGEIASQKACEIIDEKFSQIAGLSPLEDLETAIACVKFAIKSANKAIYQMALNEPMYKGMGTTVALLYKHQDFIITAHVGDSRIYECSDTLIQLTQDHTVFAEKSPKSRSLRPRHYLTKSLGLKEFVEPTIEVFPYNQEATYLLCSDGLSDYLSSNILCSLIQEPLDIHSKSKKILNTVLETPAKDNITFILIDPASSFLLK
jgi:serine/threonine protein phosphatase PrpC